MMIVQFVLFFILGVATKAFVIMLLATVLWRGALSLARKTVRAEVPISLKEVEADRDFLRVQHTVNLCRLEEKLKAEQDTHVQRRIQLDSAQERIHTLASLEPLCAELESKLDASERLVHDLRRKLDKREQQMHQLSALKPQYEAQKKQIRELTRKISRLESSNEKLKGQINTAAGIDRQSLRAFRNEIKSLAATVVAGVAKEEGAASPIAKLTADASDDGSLAASIRRLSQETKRARAGAARRSEKNRKRVSAPAKAG